MHRAEDGSTKSVQPARPSRPSILHPVQPAVDATAVDTSGTRVAFGDPVQSLLSYQRLNLGLEPQAKGADSAKVGSILTRWRSILRHPATKRGENEPALARGLGRVPQAVPQPLRRDTFR
jgi:hypothetical protein